MALERFKLPEMLARNKGGKLVALGLAFITWYAIQTVINYESVVSDVPLNIELDDGWAILDRSARTVDILFRGSQEDVRFLNPEQVKATVDLRGHTEEGTQVIRLRPKNITAPGAARPIQVRPDEVTLRLDRESEKQVPVKADLQGAPPEGYEVERVICNPATVSLVGPRQRLDEVESLRTAPIDIEGRSRTFKKLKVAVQQPSETWVARMSPGHVAVEVSMIERAATRDMAEIPVRALVDPGVRAKVDVTPIRVMLVVRARAEQLKNLQPEELAAFVDTRGLKAGASYELPVRGVAPQGYTVVTVEPPSVKVIVGEL